MFCLKLPRAVLPIDPNVNEDPYRWLDLNWQTAEHIIDRAAELWNQQNYLHFGDKPYISIYGLPRYPHITLDWGRNFVDYLKSYSHQKYQISPYLVGVGQSPEEIFFLNQMGLAVTQYAGLPDFEFVPMMPEAEKYGQDFVSSAPARQNYIEQLQRQLLRWLLMASKNIEFYPSVSVGWNAMPRAKDNNFPGYPNHPVVGDATPENFLRSLKKIWAYFLYRSRNDLEYPHFLIFAWNEMGEGAALLPFITEDGRIDMSYLEMVKEFGRFLDKFGNVSLD